jgi:hypothetical protein
LLEVPTPLAVPSTVYRVYSLVLTGCTHQHQPCEARGRTCTVGSHEGPCILARRHFEFITSSAYFLNSVSKTKRKLRRRTLLVRSVSKIVSRIQSPCHRPRFSDNCGKFDTGRPQLITRSTKSNSFKSIGSMMRRRLCFRLKSLKLKSRCSVPLRLPAEAQTAGYGQIEHPLLHPHHEHGTA